MSEPTGMNATLVPTETQFFKFDNEGSGIDLFRGGHLPEIELAYETYGKLNSNRDNAILLFHAFTGSQHASGWNPSVPGVGDLWTSECQTGWWEDFIGSGKALDTDRYFVICANYLGGCYGSTGPGSINPKTGKIYGPDFPLITFSDIVDSQIQLLDHLGIEQLHAVIGASIGGFLTVNLATRYPERARLVVSIASGIEVSPLQRILNFEQICAIERDPDFQGGNYTKNHRPDFGLAAARMISHKTFVSLGAMTLRASSEIVQKRKDFSWYQIQHPLESYILHQGRKFVKRFDANTYLHIINAWQGFDLLKEGKADNFTDLFRRCRNQKFLVFTIDSDVCFYPDEQESLARVLKDADVPTMRLTVHSDKGHDSFLLEPELYSPHLMYALTAD